MKPKTFLFSLVALFLLIGGTGCEAEKDKHIPAELYGTWKLIAFANTSDNTLHEAEPTDCEPCYTITFLKDRAITGHSSTNDLMGQFQVKGGKLHFIALGGTEINELFDGRRYVEALHQVNRFRIVSEQLELYYSETEYLLLKKR